MSPVWSMKGSAAVVGLAIAVACNDATSPHNDDFGIQGTYVLVWTRSASICSPVPLPAATLNDSSRYLNPPTMIGTEVDSMDVRKLDSTTTLLTPVNSHGVRDPHGPLTSINGGTATRSIGPLTEGPRAGGHTFSVTESDEWRYGILSLVLLPPGHGVQDQVDLGETSTFTYHDGGVSGPVYTTCVVKDTASGGRVSSRIP